MIAYARKSYMFLQQKKRMMVASAFGEDGTGDRQTRLTVDDLKYLFMMWLDIHIYRYNYIFWIGDFLTWGQMSSWVSFRWLLTKQKQNISSKGLEVVTRLLLTFDIKIIWRNVYMFRMRCSFFDMEILV